MFDESLKFGFFEVFLRFFFEVDVDFYFVVEWFVFVFGDGKVVISFRLLYLLFVVVVVF